MINKFVAMGLGALVALAPMADDEAQEQVAQAAPAATEPTPAPAHATRGSHRRRTPGRFGARGGPQGKGLSPPSAQPGPRRYRGSEELIGQSRARGGRGRNGWGADCSAPPDPNRVPSALVLDERLGGLNA